MVISSLGTMPDLKLPLTLSTFHLVPDAIYAISFTPTMNPQAYGGGSFHHNNVTIPGQVSNGLGPDGIQNGTGIDIYNNRFQAVVAQTTSGEHQDMIQG